MIQQLDAAVGSSLQQISNLRRLLDQYQGRRILSIADLRSAGQAFSDVEDELTTWRAEISADVENIDVERVDLARSLLRDIGEGLRHVEGIIQHNEAVSAEDERSMPNRLVSTLDTVVKTKNVLLYLRPRNALETPGQAELRRRVQHERARGDALRELFTRYISGSTQPLIGRRDLLHCELGTIEPLWNELPVIRGIDTVPWYDNIPRDGFVVTADMLESTQEVLQSLSEAWLSIEEQAEKPEVHLILRRVMHMSKIVTTLKVMKEGSKLLDYFVHSGIEDDQLPVSREMITSTVFENEEDWPAESNVHRYRPPMSIEFVDEFFLHQYRVAPRPWGNGQHFDLEPREPHPFRSTSPLGVSNYSIVNKVTNMFDDKVFALKITNANHQGATAMVHLRNDADNLRRICNDKNVPHIVRLVNTFSRGKEFGIVLHPAASQNLQNLLRQAREDEPRLRVLRPSLLKAVGCLSHTLAYIHNDKEMRHRDIKPQNILFVDAEGPTEAEFMWSDFGLAKTTRSVSPHGSGTNGERFGTPEYAAPEQLRNGDNHGRSADVFSFGCVLFDIFRSLIQADEPPVHPYGERIDTLHGRLEELIRIEVSRESSPIQRFTERFAESRHGSTPNRSLVPLLKLVKKMTNKDPTKRPKIVEVVNQLMVIHGDGIPVFCDGCHRAVQNGRQRRARFLHRRDFSWRKLLNMDPSTDNHRAPA